MAKNKSLSISQDEYSLLVSAIVCKQEELNRKIAGGRTAVTESLYRRRLSSYSELKKKLAIHMYGDAV